MRIDLAHEAVLIPAELWQRWRKIARAIGSDDCALAANAAPTRRNLYWVATASRILVQWTTGDQQRLANAIAVALEASARRRIEPEIGRYTQTAGRDISEKRWKEGRS
jgi:hypothetical protein